MSTDVTGRLHTDGHRYRMESYPLGRVDPGLGPEIPGMWVIFKDDHPISDQGEAYRLAREVFGLDPREHGVTLVGGLAAEGRSSSGEQPGSPHDSATRGGEPGT
jgi:hypothetical protein